MLLLAQQNFMSFRVLLTLLINKPVSWNNISLSAYLVTSLFSPKKEKFLKVKPHWPPSPLSRCALKVSLRQVSFLQFFSVNEDSSSVRVQCSPPLSSYKYTIFRQHLRQSVMFPSKSKRHWTKLTSNALGTQIAGWNEWWLFDIPQVPELFQGQSQIKATLRAVQRLQRTVVSVQQKDKGSCTKMGHVWTHLHPNV